jgi:uncharacterized protein involved in outer membrane biogenesis
MKPLRWILAVAVVLVAGVAACEYAEWPFLRHPLERRLDTTLGRAVHFGDRFGVRVFGRIRVHSDVIDVADTDPQAPPMLHAENARLVLPWHTVLERLHAPAAAAASTSPASASATASASADSADREPGVSPAALQIDALDVDRLRVVLRRTADGRANWQFGPFVPDTTSAAPSTAPPPLPRFGELVVRDGEVRLDDDVARVHATAIVRTREGAGSGEGARVEAGVASDLAPSAPSAPGSGAASPSTVVAAASAAGRTLAKAASAALSQAASEPAAGEPALPAAGLRVEAHGTFRNAPVRGWLASTGVLPLVAAAGANGPTVPLKVSLDLGSTSIRVDGHGRDLLTLADLDGDVRVAGPSLAATGDLLGITLPTTPRYALSGHVTRNGAVWDAAIASAEIGSSRLHGRMRFDAGPTPPTLTGDLVAARLLLADLGPAVGGANAGHPSAKEEPGRVLPDREFDIPSLRAMNADVTLQVASLDLGTKVLAQVSPLKTHIVLHDGVLELRDIDAVAAEGRMRGRIELDTRPALPRVVADLDGTGIELGRFVTIEDKRSKTGGGYISGKLGLQIRAQGAGRSTARILSTLHGTARLWVHGGTVSHMAIEAAGIDLIQAFGAYVQGDQPLPLRCAVGRLQVDQGVVRPDLLVLDTNDTTIDAQGTISLDTERLELTLRAHPHDFSPLTLRTPVHVTGTFEDPQVSLDKKPLLRKGALALALGLVAPPAALLALLDFGERGDHEACAQAMAWIDSPHGPAAKAAAAAPAPAARSASAAPRPTHR